ncbi:hypothetical protein K9L16_03430 [Candidatus Pacearchaeota archaeon]|nr:hypothetical protein [Candidatus Pacearchaeota archaeon]
MPEEYSQENKDPFNQVNISTITRNTLHEGYSLGLILPGEPGFNSANPRRLSKILEDPAPTRRIKSH